MTYYCCSFLSNTKSRALPLPRPDCRPQDDIPDPVKVSLVVHHQALLRNKRCLLAYLKWRADRFDQVQWSVYLVYHYR